MSTQTARKDAPSTSKGRATRDRIVAAAADLMYRHGAAGTSTPALRDAAGVSSSQIYHYFADKDDLTRAVIAFQTQAILANQTPLLAKLDSLNALNAWRDVVIDAAREHGGTGGCPLGSLSSELSDHNPQARTALAASFTAWAAAIREGLLGMVGNGTLRPETDTDRLALALLAAVQGGLLLAQAQHTTGALEAALDTVIAHIHDQATPR
ncbi:TetR/AcrR family transcriptional regulator [Actinospica sp. MGRD01-02]|uniref:TetR/AcrR family transcriptional regulator n=1 Tax=Actinospica acidithermotolerans TaxID=2828514 RepID=A0A941EAP1_9ACTN|nr:TetR/AcrR family transcriptional regulator [Actinospica acidithermotolerans]MBR7826942.1 TetR/AcrR family transcriptional regulator [Actinospica acidithermotolerans]